MNVYFLSVGYSPLSITRSGVFIGENLQRQRNAPRLNIVPLNTGSINHERGVKIVVRAIVSQSALPTRLAVITEPSVAAKPPNTDRIKARSLQASWEVKWSEDWLKLPFLTPPPLPPQQSKQFKRKETPQHSLSLSTGYYFSFAPETLSILTLLCMLCINGNSYQWMVY